VRVAFSVRSATRSRCRLALGVQAAVRAVVLTSLSAVRVTPSVVQPEARATTAIHGSKRTRVTAMWLLLGNLRLGTSRQPACRGSSTSGDLALRATSSDQADAGDRAARRISLILPDVDLHPENRRRLSGVES